jgi:hypothetical protein
MYMENNEDKQKKHYLVFRTRECKNDVNGNMQASDGDFQLVLLFLGIVTVGVTEVWVEVAVKRACAQSRGTNNRLSKHE